MSRPQPTADWKPGYPQRPDRKRLTIDHVTLVTVEAPEQEDPRQTALRLGQEAVGSYATPHTRQAAEAALAAYIELTAPPETEPNKPHIPYLDSD
jgi:hypothetical protein